MNAEQISRKIFELRERKNRLVEIYKNLDELNPKKYRKHYCELYYLDLDRKLSMGWACWHENHVIHQDGLNQTMLAILEVENILSKY